MNPLFLITLFFCLIATAQAEQIIIGIGQQATENQNLNRPQRGMSQAQVMQYFGAPTTKQPATGKPPIEIWNYPDFSVYFEGSTVIHSVLHPHRSNSINNSLNDNEAKPHDQHQSP